MPDRQYIACTFREGDVRKYTYHWDGEPLAVGDRVVVSTDRGASTITVAEIVSEPPRFATKAIAGKERVPADAVVEKEGI
jgi:hypothetical protein